MMLGIDGEGNLEGARVDYNAKGGPDLAVTNYPYGDYLQALQLNMISGTSDDLMAFQVGAMITQYAEYLEDLTPYCEKEWGANWKDKFLSVGIDQVTVGGKLEQLALALHPFTSFTYHGRHGYHGHHGQALWALRAPGLPRARCGRNLPHQQGDSNRRCMGGHLWGQSWCDRPP